VAFDEALAPPGRDAGDDLFGDAPLAEPRQVLAASDGGEDETGIEFRRERRERRGSRRPRRAPTRARAALRAQGVPPSNRRASASSSKRGARAATAAPRAAAYTNRRDTKSTG
jgi:hypothetical protein